MRHKPAVIWALLIGILVQPALSRAEVYLVEQGAPRATIIVADNAPRTIKLAGEELQTYIRKISGATLPIVSAPPADNSFRIYVGPSAQTQQLQLRVDDLENGAFRIVTGDHWLALLGADRDFTFPEPWPRNKDAIPAYLQQWDAITGEHFSSPLLHLWRKVDQTQDGTGLWEIDLDNAGTFFAVNHLLHQLGVRWYMPGELGEVFPQRSTITLPTLELTSRPDFILRNLYVMGHNFYSGNRDRILWQMRLRANQGYQALGIVTNVSVAHGTANVIRREETQQAHPEYFAQRNDAPITTSLLGKDGPGVPCLVSQPLVDANVRYLGHLFDTYKLPMVSVGPTDGFTFLCECEAAQAFAAPERGWNGAMSDYVWQYVARVAQGVARMHPQHKIQALAYSTYQQPPRQLDSLPSNVVVGIAQARVMFGDHPTRDRIRDLRQQWLAKITSGVPLYQYEYYLQGWRKNIYRGVPVYFTDLIAEDLRSLRGISMGEYIEIYPSPTNYLNTYVTARLLWDADQDVDAIVNEFITSFYGPAAEQMRAFFTWSQTNWKELPKHQDSIDQAFALIDAARAAAGDTVFGRRINLIIQYMEPLKAQRAALDKHREDVRSITAAPLAAPLQLDGQLDEPFWRSLPTYTLERALKEGESGSATVPTTVKLGWQDGALVLGVRCDEPLMGQVNIGHTRDGDLNWFHYDGIEVMIETPVYSHYQIGISPVGAVTDLSRMGGLEFGWESHAQVKGHVGADYYSLEIRLPAAGAERYDLEPLDGIAGDQPTAAAPWYINVGRLRLIAGERETQSLSGAGFHDKLKFLQLTVAP